MKIAILLGAVRAGRQSSKVGQYVANTLGQKDVDVEVIDLARSNLPIFGTAEPDDEGTKWTIDGVGNQLDEADAIIFVTPEYHGSFSGVLKNALDYYWKEFQRKPIGVVAVSAGRMAGINASTQLQHVILSLGGYPLPLKLLVSEVHHAFDETGKLADPNVERHTEKFIQEFLWFSKAISLVKKENLPV
ncbi:NAD(P)H-dependent oxidoreductase [Echinicola soli]|uniref:NAD(P)H-dependent oxidoreductase n=1 Tax=Echinicola soli TaxID=2591634 RepID=A0A514CJ89_9BACT|nr:NAD(P)H-dependent oxidoreductase [Echinicola soli]QDH79903.1 NAD(P)H-dependent oxidoreductase [Echinicola soli]